MIRAVWNRKAGNIITFIRTRVRVIEANAMEVICRSSNQYPIELTSIVKLCFCWMPNPPPPSFTLCHNRQLHSAATCYWCHLPWYFHCCSRHRVFTDFAFIALMPDKMKCIYLIGKEVPIGAQTNKQTNDCMSQYLLLRVKINECASYPRQKKEGKICMCTAQPSWLCVNGVHLCCIECNPFQMATAAATLSSSLNGRCHQSSILQFMHVLIYLSEFFFPHLIFFSCE